MTRAHLAPPTAAQPDASALSARQIGLAASLALHDELALSPKPGLVTLTDRGSHADMDAHSFMRSLVALRSYFVRMAELGAEGVAFESLQACGIAAEARMLAATGGVNTHRGAIFMLGLLCASAGALVQRPSPAALRQALLVHWGDALAARAQKPSTLPGGMAAQRFGLRSASMEAAMGLPTLFDITWPALQAARARGLGHTPARVDALFATMAELDDSNLAHRGGLEGLHFARATARAFLAGGGAAAPGGLDTAAAIGEAFVRQRLSPGGSADTLAAACWLDRVCGPVCGHVS